MQLPQKPFDNVYLDLTALQRRVIAWELQAVDFDAAAINRALHSEPGQLTAKNIGDDTAPPPILVSGDINWTLTASQTNGWRLAVPNGESLRPTAMRFLFIPICLPRANITKKLAALHGKLPYLEIEVNGPLPSWYDLRGLYITAMALLQGLLPKEI